MKYLATKNFGKLEKHRVYESKNWEGRKEQVIHLDGVDSILERDFAAAGLELLLKKPKAIPVATASIAPSGAYRIVPILCLDLDGTVRMSKSGKKFISGPDDITLMDGITDAVAPYHDNGWIILGISNQEGIAHGFKTVEMNNEEMDVTEALFVHPETGEAMFSIVSASFMDENGIVEPFNRRSLMRKPETGILAVFEHTLLVNGMVPMWDSSLFVGDGVEDFMCARNAGIRFCHIEMFLQ